MSEQTTVRLTLKHIREVQNALKGLEDRFVHEGGWWNVPAGRIDHIETDIWADPVAYDTLEPFEFIKTLGLKPSWVIEYYEV